MWITQSIWICAVNNMICELTLVKSTLTNLPKYYLSLFPIPMGGPIGLRDFKEIFYGVVVGMSLNSI